MQEPTAQEIHTVSLRDGKVTFTAESSMPRATAKTLEAQTDSFYRYEVPKFRKMELRVVAKAHGERTRCEATMHTERGDYQAYAEHADAQQGLSLTFDALHSSIIRDFEHRISDELDRHQPVDGNAYRADTLAAAAENAQHA